jgi:hypothetical protein
MKTLYKLLRADGSSLRAEGRVYYPLPENGQPGAWTEVDGNGAHCAEPGGLILEGRVGPLAVELETDNAPDVVSSIMTGVHYRRRVRVVRILEQLPVEFGITIHRQGVHVGLGGDERWIMLGPSESHGQVGGYCWCESGSESHGQVGGFCRCDGSKSYGQAGGICRCERGSESHGQAGGDCWCESGSESHGQVGGICLCYGSKSYGQAGGDCWCESGSESHGQAGGDCWCDGSKSYGQLGGNLTRLPSKDDRP